MKNIKIRKASKKDLDEILNLLYQLQRPRPKTSSEHTAFRKRIFQYLDENDKKIIVSECNSKIIGLVSIMLLPRLNRTKLELYIPELVVSEDHRGLGVGKSLIKSCVNIAKKKKCFRIRLESGNQRKDAHQFYKKIGFEQSALSYTMTIEQ
ncbi:MAG: GNAT family N-acetyltransferase [Candidatus Nitrosotenuis sp.]|nr:MAG: GNAT family N-acetyltransferase [Candidatus Nitrosotenuis sp.]